MSKTHKSALIIEECQTTRQLIAGALRLEGFRCDEAANYLDADQRLERGDFDAVVASERDPCDDCCRFLVDCVKRQQPPLVILLTETANRQLERNLIDQGIKRVYRRPVDYRCLAVKVAFLVQRTLAVALGSPIGPCESDTSAEISMTFLGVDEDLAIDSVIKQR